MGVSGGGGGGPTGVTGVSGPTGCVPRPELVPFVGTFGDDGDEEVHPEPIPARVIFLLDTPREYACG